MDYGKFRYEEAQKLKESRKKTTHVTVKEVKFRPKIGKGDFDTKVRHMRDFLEDGHKVKVTLQFRGREVAHPELGAKILDAALEQLGSIAKVETQARLEGRNMTMVLSPDKKPVKKSSDRDEPQESALVVENVVQPEEILEETSEVQEERKHDMPKMKTNKTAAKRFKVSGTGKLRRQKANRQHLFEKKSSVRTRRLAGTTDVDPGDTKNIKRLLGMR